MKILITGAKGMLGQMLEEVLQKKHDLVLTDRDNMDITDKSKVDEIVSREKPEVIIHAAAYVDVEKAEDEKALAKRINITGSRNVANAAKKAGATVIAISTDYVYDGREKVSGSKSPKSGGGIRKKPYKETDQVNPLSVYAKSKLQGEYEIIKSCAKHYILRVSWLYGEHSNRNFANKIIDWAKKGDLSVIDDQIGSPTYTRDLAQAIGKIVSRQKAVGRRLPCVPYGIYHFSGSGEATRFEFAKLILKLAKIDAALSGVKSSAFLTKAERPAYSYLDKSKIEKAFGIKVRSWQAMLRDYFRRK